ncbi:hypothetical protein GCM10010399_64160 [Dactylosporangium fulvum]|uniref:Uncharacterized protein n=1 Tax=Dactylosporangium fulvum TaxID=53359 RepID=A0ABY5W8W7_9ACTN|nr:hypothetical protein [Dactylosporangium fulvum]UWP85761.1 hypothetical protein Dfulv_16575 [Dactylosporangium fulvum]
MDLSTVDRRTRENLARHLRHVAAMGGWVTRLYFDRISENVPSRDLALAEKLIERGERDRIRTYELTDAGRAWLAGQES